MTAKDNKTKSDQAKQHRKRVAARVFLEPGTSPGYLRAVPGSPPAKVFCLSSLDGIPCEVKEIADLADLPQAAEKGMRWIRVVGLGELDPLLRITDFYHIRHLALEDTLAPGWRTKMEHEDDFIFFVLQGPPDCDNLRKPDRLSMFCKQGLIISFEDEPTYVVDHLWKRLQEEKVDGLTQHLSGFLTYMVLDILVDGFFPHLDKIDESLAALEEVLISHVPTREELNRLYGVKKDLVSLRRLITPFKEIRTDLVKSHAPDTLQDLRPFYSDLSDHIMEVEEMLDTYHEITQSLDQTCQSILTNKVNEIVRILTIISTVFMPLSFIVGLYGMNFETMPELHWRYGYPLVLVFMVLIVLAMFVLFKKRKWL